MMKLQTPNVTLLTCEGARHQRDIFCGLAALHFDAVKTKFGAWHPATGNRRWPVGQTDDAVLEATQITEIKGVWMI